jgi:hypothetical protein
MSEPLPDPSGASRGCQVALTPLDEAGCLSSRVPTVIGAAPALGITSESQVVAQTHVGS